MQRAEILGREDIGRKHHGLIARHRRIGAHGLGIMRMQTAREYGLAAFGDPVRHRDRLDRRRRSVIHRRIGDIHRGQSRDLGLELENGLQSALRDLRLIGRIAREKFGALDQMIDACGNMMLIGPRANKKWH